MNKYKPRPWMRDGAPCWYYDEVDRSTLRYPGWIEGKPRSLGGDLGPWVCRVRLEPGCGYWRSHVPYAAVWCLKPREEGVVNE